jgi:hypothetical protein
MIFTFTWLNTISFEKNKYVSDSQAFEFVIFFIDFSRPLILELNSKICQKSLTNSRIGGTLNYKILLVKAVICGQIILTSTFLPFLTKCFGFS